MIAERTCTQTCAGCPVEFVPTRSAQRYHDERCATAARVRRLRAARAKGDAADDVVKGWLSDLARRGLVERIGDGWRLTQRGESWFRGFAEWFDLGAAA